MPSVERRLAFAKQLGAVVGAGDASPSAGNVVHHQFDDVRRHVKFDHAGDERPPQVMQRPRRNDRVALLARGGEHRRAEAILHPQIVVIVTALDVETKAVLRHLGEDWTDEAVQGTVCHSGKFEGWDVAVVEAGPGNQSTRGRRRRRLDFKLKSTNRIVHYVLLYQRYEFAYHRVWTQKNQKMKAGTIGLTPDFFHPHSPACVYPGD